MLSWALSVSAVFAAADCGVGNCNLFYALLNGLTALFVCNFLLFHVKNREESESHFPLHKNT